MPRFPRFTIGVVALLAVAALSIASSAVAQQTQRISVGYDGSEANGRSYFPVISGNGRYVSYLSEANNLVANDLNGVGDVFLWDRRTGTTSRVSLGEGGVESNGESSAGAISRSGRYLAFETTATNIVAADGDPQQDVILLDRNSGSLELISVAIGGGGSNAACYATFVSDNGRYVIFESTASNLVENDLNGERDVFLRDRRRGVTERISVSSAGVEADNFSGSEPQYNMSQDGRFILFYSYAGNLTAESLPQSERAYLRDRRRGTTTLVSVNPDGTVLSQASSREMISRSGRKIGFSVADSLAPEDTNTSYDLYTRGRKRNNPKLQSLGFDGMPVQEGTFAVLRGISENGRHLLLRSASTNLIASANNSINQLLVKDSQRNKFFHITIGVDGSAGNGDSFGAGLSLSGRWAAFDSNSTNLVDNDTNGFTDVFVRRVRVSPDLRVEAN